MPTNAEMVDYIWPISTAYVFGGSRYEPYNTDCSGMVCAAFWHIHGVNPYTLGDWTGAQWANGLLTHIWWGTTPYLPYDNMQKGDVIFTSTSSPDFSTGNGSHVGFYTGDPNAPFLSHFANGGPYVTAVNGVYGGNETYYGVARYTPGSEDDVSASDLWSYQNPNESIDAYQALMETHAAVTGGGISSWAYKNPSEKIDAYGVLMDMHKDIDGLKAAVDKLQGGGSSVVSIDYDKLANAVADKIAARMKD